jgi:hypothetical protein
MEETTGHMERVVHCHGRTPETQSDPRASGAALKKKNFFFEMGPSFLFAKFVRIQ